MCKLLMNPAGLLLLDEPTNHLDISTREVLEAAMQDFEGAIVLVSHDRYFINEVATHVVHIEAGEATTYAGNYDEYLHQMALASGPVVKRRKLPSSTCPQNETCGGCSPNSGSENKLSWGHPNACLGRSNLRSLLWKRATPRFESSRPSQKFTAMARR
ncbi:MAG: hypothetical protein R3E66_11695 [bacterium]